MSLSIAERIAAALHADMASHYEERMEHVCALQRDGSREVLNAALELCASVEAAERALGADVLSQLGGYGPLSPYREPAAPILAGLLHDPDEAVLSAALLSLDQLGLEIDGDILAELARHPSASVRHAVALALPSSGGAATEALLIRLMSDSDEDVRDWATFGLGAQTELDSPAIRDALLERTRDQHTDTRAEAMVGLALRHDQRLLPILLQELCSREVGSLIVEAARELAAPELVPALEALSSWWDVDPKLLAEATEACRKGA